MRLARFILRALVPLLLLGCAALPAPAADVGFGAPRSFDSSEFEFQDADFADIDGDGTPDFVTASLSRNPSRRSGRLTWYRRDPVAGAYEVRRLIDPSLAVSYCALATGDLDGDTDLDVVAADAFHDRIVWFENDGAGNFAPPVLVTDQVSFDTILLNANSSHRLGALAIGDLDGDLDLDIASASGEDDKIAWYRNTDGHGAFGPPVLISTAADGASSLALANLDGDTDLDVVAVSALDNTIRWFANTNGMGVFSAANVVQTGADGANNVAVADLDGNTTPDIVYSSVGDNTLGWHSNNGAGTFAPAVVIAGGSDPCSFRVQDFNGDLAPDIVASFCQVDAVFYFQNDNLGGGGFLPSVQLSFNAVSKTVVAAANDDGDADADIIFATSFRPEIFRVENLGGGSFAAEERVTSPAVSTPTDGRWVDLDGDNDQDLVVFFNGFFGVHFYENADGAGRLLGQRRIAQFTNFGTLASFLDVGDIDGDNDLDILAALDRTSTDIMSWHENTSGDASTWMAHDIVVPVEARNLRLVDLDGDNDLDILAGNRHVRWYRNTDGLGAFVLAQDIALGANPSAVVPADIDGDTDMDAVYSSLGELHWAENTNGMGAFGPPTALTAFAEGPNRNARTLRAADVNGDNRVDLVAGSVVPRVWWLPNTATPGVFAPAVTVLEIATLNDQPESLVLEDVDGDSDLDIAVGFRGYVGWFENTDGLGAFASQRIASIPPPGASAVTNFIDFGDGDGDGDLDLLWAANFSGHSAGPGETVLQWIPSIAPFLNRAAMDSIELDHATADVTVLWEPVPGAAAVLIERTADGREWVPQLPPLAPDAISFTDADPASADPLRLYRALHFR